MLLVTFILLLTPWLSTASFYFSRLVPTLRGNACPDALRPRDAECLAGAFPAERGTRGLNAYLPSIYKRNVIAG